MHINVQAIRVKTPVSERLIKSWVRAALQAPAKQTKRTDGPASEITIRFVGSTEGQHLNDQFRKKSYATNVLTFSYSKNPLVADIVLCTPVLRREAKAQQKTLAAHTAHLVVHGVLHARGFDHETALDANKMEACERQILHSLGFADPYADGAP